ncbi:RNA polymerase alpha subunit C-terminal domain-containing protein [Pedobacter sp. SL55]|uniref:RNA polymerase alpha subunit C-terminal domain-containing protein n=1 Tax=Pedobacter sp. SL55 TaxID=2995161 RepID=UPI0022703A31|nr:RNA polymerase alpha subunit C-terminal domain-containing protein [Pedobacter sp. SL55]WAC39753.1 RNA polymerase alpha subunit C-terminal domain-containing protein [Pedobacter sp. SL55]
MGKTLRKCEKGHEYYKSSNCPTCPICENGQKPKDGFLAALSAPARRALTNNGIHSLKELAAYTEEEILKLHGMGKASLQKLKALLANEQLDFKR